MAFRFYDRERETQWLGDAWRQVQEDCSRMLELTGRRRVGKTSLVNHLFEGKSAPYVFFYVNKDMTRQGNLEVFWEDNAKALGQENVPVKFDSVAAMFGYLLDQSEKMPMVVMIDEFQNLESVEPAFFGELQKLWDKRRKSTKMLLVLTGSVATAMREVVEEVNAPLYGRKNGQWMLQPFTTTTIKEILSDYRRNWRAQDLLTLYMLTGGVAKYIEELMEGGRTDSDAMLEYAMNPGSFFMTEGEVLLRTEFKSDYAVYFEILSKIAAGKTRRSEIVSAFDGVDIGSQLRKLEDVYRLIVRHEPIGGAQNNRGFRYEISDAFLQFWFQYIYPNRSLIERGDKARLMNRARRLLSDDLEHRVLPNFFRQVLFESGNYSEAGSWWDRKGQNEIDIVAVNPFAKEILFAEVKLDRNQYDEAESKKKAYLFLASQTKYQAYAPRFECLSLDDIKR